MKYLIIFFVFSITFLVMQALSRSKYIKNLFDRFGVMLTRRAFPDYSESTFNLFGLLRILFAIVILHRSFNGWIYLLPEEQLELQGLIYILELLMAFFLLFGFLTQYVLLFFIGFMWQVGEKITQTVTLGNDVAAMLAVFFLFSQAGKNLSLDSLILKFKPQLTSYFFYKRNTPSSSALAIYKTIALLSYWLICCYSLANHLNEEAWMTGLTGPLLLSSSFMSPFHDTFSLIFSNSPFLVYLSRVSLWLMMIWYILIIPFVLLGGIFRTYIILWGLLFFILSTFFLGLGSLGEIEIILWTALFWPTSWGLKGSKSIFIFYDDKCNLCDRTLQFFCFVDIFSIIKPKPASLNISDLSRWGISYKQALTDLYAVDTKNKKIVSGYDMYFFLSRRIICLFPLFPLFAIGYLFNIGPKIYSFIAKRRKDLFGVCIIPRNKIDHLDRPVSSDINNFEAGVISHVLLLGVVFFLTIPLPFLGENPLTRILPVNLSSAAHVYGITPINVFNKEDLSMTENWFVLLDSENQLLPVLNYDGSRGYLHKSDKIYFGNTLTFRRLAIGSEGCLFEEHRKKIIYLAEVALNSTGKSREMSNIKYIQFHQPPPDFNLLKNENLYRENEISTICERVFSLIERT